MTAEDMSPGSADSSPPDLRSAAVHRIQGKREFGEHLIAYLSVNVLLVAVWAVVGWASGAWFPWFVFPLAGWGIGLAFHAWSAYGPPSRPLSEEAIEREMHRLGG